MADFEYGVAVGFRTKEECDYFLNTFKQEEPEVWAQYVSNTWIRASDTAIAVHYNNMVDPFSYDDPKEANSIAEYAVDDFKACYVEVAVQVVLVEQDAGIKESKDLTDIESATIIDHLDSIISGVARVEIYKNEGFLD